MISTNKKILIIEDEPIIRETIADLLEMEQYRTLTAENGQTGVQLAQEQFPDLILCDIAMPEMDGHGVLNTLRQNPRTANIPFIFLTAKADKQDLRHGMELGADDYLTKPFTPDELIRAIETRFNRQALSEQQAQQKLEELRSSITHALPHELHTPLNGIIGMSELLISDYDTLEPQEILEMAEDINTSAKRLYRLNQNFLLYAEMELMAYDPERIQALRSYRIT
ncbi:MAG: response regulator, partial [Leptolyngbyaceae cyanobacterium bins.59]|nr:response regulator [Leptolyngbyaceae cyanobacterium bins.59]